MERKKSKLSLNTMMFSLCYTIIELGKQSKDMETVNGEVNVRVFMLMAVKLKSIIFQILAIQDRLRQEKEDIPKSKGWINFFVKFTTKFQIRRIDFHLKDLEKLTSGLTKDYIARAKMLFPYTNKSLMIQEKDAKKKRIGPEMPMLLFPRPRQTTTGPHNSTPKNEYNSVGRDIETETEFDKEPMRPESKKDNKGTKVTEDRNGETRA